MPSCPFVVPVPPVPAVTPKSAGQQAGTKKKSLVPAPAATAVAQESGSSDSTPSHKDNGSSQKGSSTGHSKADRSAARAAS